LSIHDGNWPSNEEALDDDIGDEHMQGVKPDGTDISAS
jgi:hypothetical protein